jgi:hypothetical protein
VPALLTAATRVLRLRFVSDDVRTTHDTTVPTIDFVAYGHETVFAGTIRLDADRLTDLLNATDELELVDVVCIGRDGRVVEAERAVIPRAEVIAVKAGEPRGRSSLRRRARQTAVGAAAAGYKMHGYLHTRPGADPLLDLGRRPPMVPLTDATIVYEAHDGWRRERATTLILNRDTADTVRLARPDELDRLLAHRGAA